jgi:hypothetical protein
MPEIGENMNDVSRPVPREAAGDVEPRALAYFDQATPAPALLRPILWYLFATYTLSALTRAVQWFDSWLHPQYGWRTTRTMAERWYGPLDAAIDAASPYLIVAIALLALLALRRRNVFRILLILAFALALMTDLAYIVMSFDPANAYETHAGLERVVDETDRVLRALDGFPLYIGVLYVLMRRDVRAYYRGRAQ